MTSHSPPVDFSRGQIPPPAALPPEPEPKVADYQAYVERHIDRSAWSMASLIEHQDSWLVILQEFGRAFGHASPASRLPSGSCDVTNNWQILAGRSGCFCPRTAAKRSKVWCFDICFSRQLKLFIVVRMYEITHDREARNPKELTVRKGEVIEVGIVA